VHISNIKVDSRNTRNQFHSVKYHYDLFDMRNSPNYKITRPIVYLELEFKKILIINLIKITFFLFLIILNI
jgi:hypothetical protein